MTRTISASTTFLPRANTLDYQRVVASFSNTSLHATYTSRRCSWSAEGIDHTRGGVFRIVHFEPAQLHAALLYAHLRATARHRALVGSLLSIPLRAFRLEHHCPLARHS